MLQSARDKLDRERLTVTVEGEFALAELLKSGNYGEELKKAFAQAVFGQSLDEVKDTDEFIDAWTAFLNKSRSEQLDEYGSTSTIQQDIWGKSASNQDAVNKDFDSITKDFKQDQKEFTDKITSVENDGQYKKDLDKKYAAAQGQKDFEENFAKIDYEQLKTIFQEQGIEAVKAYLNETLPGLNLSSNILTAQLFGETKDQTDEYGRKLEIRGDGALIAAQQGSYKTEDEFLEGLYGRYSDNYDNGVFEGRKYGEGYGYTEKDYDADIKAADEEYDKAVNEINAEYGLSDYQKQLDEINAEYEKRKKEYEEKLKEAQAADLEAYRTNFANLLENSDLDSDSIYQLSDAYSMMGGAIAGTSQDLIENEKWADKVSYANKKSESDLSNLIDNWEELSEKLKSVDPGENIQVFQQLEEYLNEIFNIPRDTLSKDFLGAKENLELFNLAISGSEEAWDKYIDKLQKDIIGPDVDDIVNDLNNFTESLDIG